MPVPPGSVWLDPVSLGLYNGKWFNRDQPPVNRRPSFVAAPYTLWILNWYPLWKMMHSYQIYIHRVSSLPVIAYYSPRCNGGGVKARLYWQNAHYAFHTHAFIVAYAMWNIQVRCVNAWKENLTHTYSQRPRAAKSVCFVYYAHVCTGSVSVFFIFIMRL